MSTAKPALHAVDPNETLAIAKERILVIGGPGLGRQSQLHDIPNLREFGAVVLYLSCIPAEANQGHMPTTLERYSEIIEWVKEGHTIVILGTMPDFSWQVRKAQSTVINTPLQQTELFRGITFHRTNGKLVEFVGPRSIESKMTRWVPFLAYDAILAGTNLSPILRVSKQSVGPDQIVGAHRPIGRGTAVFLPILSNGSAQYLVDVAQIPSLLECVPDELPSWSAEYKTKAETTAAENVDAINANIAKLVFARSDFDSVVASEQVQKHLFTATGDALVDSVLKLLVALGLKAIQGPRQRADVIAWDGTRLMAIEVKGLEGAARETNLRQVDRWKADVLAAMTAGPDELADNEDLVMYRDCLTKLDVPLDDSRPTDCKGVMIVNTFRKQGLSERGESFPDPLRKLIVRSNVCALTGLQLFGIRSKVAEGALSKSAAVDELLSRSGICEIATDWQSFLSH